MTRLLPQYRGEVFGVPTEEGVADGAVRVDVDKARGKVGALEVGTRYSGAHVGLTAHGCYYAVLDDDRVTLHHPVRQDDAASDPGVHVPLGLAGHLAYRYHRGSMVTSEPLRIAVVGAGANIAEQHLLAIEATSGAVLAAVCDVNPAAEERLKARTAAPYFSRLDEMLTEVAPDIVTVLTPHPFHAAVAEAALSAGAHVLVEKPMAVTASEADRMIAAASEHGRVLAVSFQHRFSPMTERLREWVASGELGEVVRMEVTEPWLRTAAYFRAASWRATWRGEGGGVLLNQAPHALDLLTHLMGPPSRVTGLTRTVRHGTECEDTAHALLEWAGGAVGYFASTTTEPETGRRLELVADRAKVVVEGNILRRTDIDPGLRDHALSDPQPFGMPRITERAPEELTAGATHAPVYQDLIAAVKTGAPPRCRGEDGRASLELANAIALSSWTGRPVELPLDRAEYDAALDERRSATA